MKNSMYTLGAVASLLSVSQITFALDAHPGDAKAVPVGHGLLGLYYIQQNLKAAKPKAGANPAARTNVGVLRALYATEVGGVQVNPQMILPFGSIKGRDQLSSIGSKSGIGDVSLLASVMLKQDPATQTSIYLMPGVTFPTGEYDNSKLSIGENRHKFYLQLGAQTGVTDNWLIDGFADVTFYGDNNDHAAGRLEQKPMFNLQSFLRYRTAPTTEFAMGFRHSTGGETSIAGVDQDDRLRKTSILFTAAHWLTPSDQLMINWGRDVSVNTGFENTRNIELRYIKAF